MSVTRVSCYSNLKSRFRFGDVNDAFLVVNSAIMQERHHPAESEMYIIALLIWRRLCGWSLGLFFVFFSTHQCRIPVSKKGGKGMVLAWRGISLSSSRTVPYDHHHHWVSHQSPSFEVQAFPALSYLFMYF